MLSGTDILATIRWWLALMVIGTAVMPLSATLFSRLADRGYAFTKMLGLLLVTYLFWILGSLGFLGNNLGGILFALAVVAGMSVWAFRQNRAELTEWVRHHLSYMLICELLFLLFLLFWAWVRAQNPEIANTEKPMEFAFLNASVRTPTFPPIDPWLSGFAISYYYFGYTMMSVVTRLAAIPTSVGFNLASAWLMAGTAVGSFGLVFNLVSSRGKSVGKTAVLLGIIAALAIPLAGNQEITLEVMYGNGLGSDRFWEWIDIRDLSASIPQESRAPRYETSQWWWWRSSRPLNETTLAGQQSGLEPIVEFPAFSFILGDIHPHVLALPYALLSLGLAFAWYLESKNLQIEDWQLKMDNPQSIFSYLQSLIPNWPLFAITTLILGGLSFLNTWDVLIHLFVVLAAYALGQWQRRGSWKVDILIQTAVLAITIILPAIILYFPFYIGFESQAGAPFILPMLMQPTRLPQFLVVFGMPLSVILLLLVGLAVRQRLKGWRVLVQTAVLLSGGLLLLSILLAWLIAASTAGVGTVIGLANELGTTLPSRPDQDLALGWGFQALLAIAPDYFRARVQFPGMTLLLSTMAGVIVMTWSNYFSDPQLDSTSANEAISELEAHQPQQSLINSPLPFTLLLILTATLLTLGPEFVYLKDNFGVRLNTIFKFYYQAWVMFGIGAVVALEILWQEWGSKVPGFVGAALYIVLLVSALQFPYFAIQSRAIEYRGDPTAENRLPATLDGLAKLQTFNPDEYEAIMWLANNSEGLPVVLEATGGAYSNYGRVSANTGLPTVLGWANHEYQWRGSDTPEPGRRTPHIQEIYTNPFWDNTDELLNQYDVEYIYVGGLERSTYNSNGTLPAVEKFNELLEVAYQNNSVTIYRWHPDE